MATAAIAIKLLISSVQETADFVPNSCDPHGLAMFDGKLIGCDAGIHPGWPNNDSPTRRRVRLPAQERGRGRSVR